MNGLPYRTTDWMGTPTLALGETLPPGWGFYAPQVGSAMVFTYGGGTTYSSTNGMSVELSLSVGWGGVSVDTPLEVYSNVTGTTSSGMNIVSCTLGWVTDPSGNDGVPYVWTYSGDPQTSVDHIWLWGWCGGQGEGYCTA